MSVAVANLPPGNRAAAAALDEDGFLIETRLWTRELAQQLASDCGVGRLGETHWMIIAFVRDRFFRLGALPPMRNLCHKLGVDRGAVKQAFGDCRQLWRIAGLPNPGTEALSYMA